MSCPRPLSRLCLSWNQLVFFWLLVRHVLLQEFTTPSAKAQGFSI